MVGVPQLRPWYFFSGWQAEHLTGWSPERSGHLIRLSTASSTESRRRLWPFATRSSTFQRPLKTWRWCPRVLQGWHGTELLLKLRVPSTAATSGSSLQAALMVTATGTGNCSPLSSCRLCVTIRAASLTPTWAGRGRCTTPGCSATARCTGSQSTLLQGTSSSQMVGTHACKAHSHSSLPTSVGIKVWLPSALTAIIQGTLCDRACLGMMKTRFRAIFLQALEVHHTFVPHVVTACAILHNICLSAGDYVVAEDEPEVGGDDEGEAGLEDVSGARWWDQLCCEVSALEEVPLDQGFPKCGARTPGVARAAARGCAR
nr:uncharacterized protein LOC107372343 [Nothobranchius furzeri]